MKFIDTDLQDYIGTNFSVSKDANSITQIRFSNGFAIRNLTHYATIMLGQAADPVYTYEDYFQNFTYDKVLIAGLGFGLIPQTLSEVNSCSKIDVVEIDQEIIDYNVSSNHLNSDINLIQGDIFEYTTVDKYDLIIIDTIWDEDEMSEAQVDLLTSKFLNTNLNIDGALYIPIKNKWLINK